jgi:hypothetical protein
MASRTPDEREGGRCTADRWSPVQTKDRLPPGQLASASAAAPGEPVAVACVLGRSSDAVANCLARRAAAGDLKQVSSAARRSRISVMKIAAGLGVIPADLMRGRLLVIERDADEHTQPSVAKRARRLAARSVRLGKGPLGLSGMDVLEIAGNDVPIWGSDGNVDFIHHTSQTPPATDWQGRAREQQNRREK